MKKLILTSLAAIFALALAANAAVIDFNSNGTQDYFVPSVESNGFTFVGDPQNDKNIGTSNNFDAQGQSNGTVYFTAWSNSSTATLVDFYATDLSLFSLNSFEFNNAYPNGGSRTSSLTVIGTYANNTTVSQTFTNLGGLLSFTPLYLTPAFQNLQGVRIDASGAVDVRALFDNFEVNSVGVPDGGATVALLGFGVLILAGMRRKLFR